MISLQRGKDVLAVLSTGFGNSMIFTVFALSARELNRPSFCFGHLLAHEHYIGLNCRARGLCLAAEHTPESLQKIIEHTPFFFSLADC